MARNREIVSFSDYTGGLNDTLTPDRMASNELEQADNIDLSIRGGFSYRKGTTNTNQVSFEDDVMYFIEYPLKDGGVLSLAVMKDKKLYDITNGTKTEIAQLANYDIDHIIYRNAVYLLDGENFYSYGSYDYNTQVTVAIKEGDIVWNSPISTGTNPGVDKHFYKAKADIASSTLKTGSYGDTTKWEDITHITHNVPNVLREVKPLDGETDNDLKPIKRCRVIEIHPKSQRIFVGGDPEDNSCIYYSESGKPNHFKVMSKLYPTGGEGKLITIITIMRSIIVGYQRGWYEYNGIDEQDWNWLKLPIPYGPVNNNVIELTPAGFTFTSNNGIWKVSTSMINSDMVVQSEKTLLNNLSEGKVEGIIKSIKNFEHTCSAFEDGKYYLAYSETDSETNDKILVYDFVQNNFVRYTDLKVNYLFTKLDGDIYFCSKNYVNKFSKDALNDIDENGNVVPIKLNFKSSRYNFGTPFNMKAFNRFFFSFNQGEDIDEYLKLWLKIDYTMTSTQYIDLNNKSFIWGLSQWGNQWGYTDMQSLEMDLRKKGIRIQVIITGDMLDSAKDVVIYGFGFDVEYLRARAKSMSTVKLIDEDYNIGMGGEV